MVVIFNHPDWPGPPYMVIDQNCLRDTIVTAAILDAKKGRSILLRDIATVELAKSEPWSDN